MKVLLAAAATFLGALLFLQWKDWPPGPPRFGSDGTAPAGAPGTSSAEPNPLAPLTTLEAKETYASVNERTLFRPQRKPPEPEPAEPPPEVDTGEASTLEGLDLSAVVIAPGIVQAWVSDPAQGFQRLRPGGLYQGWTVKDITPDTLVLERQGKTNTLVLQDFSQGSPPAAAVPSPAPAPVSRRQSPAGPRGVQPPPGVQAPRPDRPALPPRSRPTRQPSSPASPQASPNVRRSFPQEPE